MDIKVREAQHTVLHLGTQATSPVFFGGRPAGLMPRLLFMAASTVKAYGAVGSTGILLTQQEQELRVDDGGHEEQDVGVEVLLCGNGILILISLSSCTLLLPIEAAT